MKRSIFAVAVLMYCLLVAISSNAQQEIIVPKPVKESFGARFRNSESERWVKIQTAYVATFKEGDTWRDAYFTEDGEFKGIGKYITVEGLPMFVHEAISTQYPNYEVCELYQYESLEDGLCFYARLTSPKHEMIVQLSPSGEVTYSRKTRIKEAQPSGNDIAINKANQ